ncbi:MAG TPA: hypothetical protein VMT69_01995 [Kineosporiaceae bacterium]|nr:hypothetical protein [Kineosporiaceae bacterium]
MTDDPKRRGRLVAFLALALAAALAACSAPSSTFVASPDDDLVLKLPRSWSTVRDTPSADASGQPDGGWVAVFDGSRDPDVKHLDLSSTVHEPVAYAQVSVMTADQASGMTADKLRDLLLPFTASARAQYTADPRAATFRQIADYDVRGSAGSGVHVVFSYNLGHGREVFDQTALVGSHRTRIYLLLIRCDQACYDSHKQQIADVVSHFTVKVP